MGSRRLGIGGKLPRAGASGGLGVASDMGGLWLDLYPVEEQQGQQHQAQPPSSPPPGPQGYPQDWS